MLRMIARKRLNSSENDIYRSVGNAVGSIYSIAQTVTVTICACLLFGGSIPVFFEGLDISMRGNGPVNVSGAISRVASMLRRHDSIGSYGLFRSMTGLHGREELVIEAAIDRVAAATGADDAWFEVPFRFKPGALERRPPWNSPHQPRLDWQVISHPHSLPSAFCIAAAFDKAQLSRQGHFCFSRRVVHLKIY